MRPEPVKEASRSFSKPELRILATSRESLRIPGEHTWRVPSLAVPPDAAAPPVGQRHRLHARVAVLAQP